MSRLEATRAITGWPARSGRTRSSVPAAGKPRGSIACPAVPAVMTRALPLRLQQGHRTPAQTPEAPAAGHRPEGERVHQARQKERRQRSQGEMLAEEERRQAGRDRAAESRGETRPREERGQGNMQMA